MIFNLLHSKNRHQQLFLINTFLKTKELSNDALLFHRIKIYFLTSEELKCQKHHNAKVAGCQ